MSPSSLKRTFVPKNYDSMGVSPQTIATRRKQAQAWFWEAWPVYRHEVNDFGSFCVMLWCGGTKLTCPLNKMAYKYMAQYHDINGKYGGEDLMVRLMRCDLDPWEWRRVHFLSDENTKLDLPNTLSRTEHAVLTLRCLWGFDLEEIAGILSMATSEVDETIWSCAKHIAGPERAAALRMGQ